MDGWMDGWMGGQADMTKLTVAFCNFANTPKKWTYESQLWICDSKLTIPTIQLLFNPLNTKLNPICHLLALLGAQHIIHVSRIRVKVIEVTTVSCVDPDELRHGFF